MSKIQLTDTTMDVLVKLSEGNPGAASVLTRLLTEGEKIDPINSLGGFGIILNLDTQEIYGSRIWMLYKDVCGQDLTKTMAASRAVQLGLLSQAELTHAIDNRGDGIDIDKVLEDVKERLGDFGE